MTWSDLHWKRKYLVLLMLELALLCCRMTLLSFGIWSSTVLFVPSIYHDECIIYHDCIIHTIHVWYIYLHLPWKSTFKCSKYAIHPWMVWVILKAVANKFLQQTMVIFLLPKVGTREVTKIWLFVGLPSLKLTANAPANIDGLKTPFCLGARLPIFRGRSVSWGRVQV